jgi:hypothetical protein
MPAYMVKPTNRILAGPSGAQEQIIEMKVGAAATPAKMVAGRLVIYDAAAGSVKESGSKSDSVIGVIEVRSGKLLADTHAVADPVSIIPRTSGAWVVLTLVKAGAAVTPGDPIVSDIDGKAAKQLVGAVGAQGSVVAHALEAVDPTNAEATCLCALTGGAETKAAA